MAWVDVFHLGNVCVVFTAFLTILYASWRAAAPRGTVMAEATAHEGVTEVRVWMAVMFVVLASAGLVLLFYLISALFLAFKIIFSLASVSSVVYVLHPHVLTFFPRLERFFWNVPCLGTVLLVDLLLLPLAAATVAAWWLTGFWLLNNVLCLAVCVFVINYIRLPSLKVATVLLGLLFLYDMFWVFFSERVFRENVMVSVATEEDLPVKVVYPLDFTSDSVFTMLGLGDIVLPGFLLAFLMRFDREKTGSFWGGYFVLALVSYLVALIACEVVVVTTRVAQPAMVYIVPATLMVTFGRAYRRGELGELWKGRSMGLAQDSQMLFSEEDIQTEDDETHPVGQEETTGASVAEDGV